MCKKAGAGMRIMIVDDHPLFREALGNLLEQLYPSAVVFEVGSVEEAVGVLNQYLGFDLIMLDVFVPGANGLAGLALLQAKALQAPIVIMSCVDDPEAARDAVERGVRGYISKSAGAGDVKNALHLILAGEIYISPVMLATTGNPVTAPAPAASVNDNNHLTALPTLTQRQREVFRLMAQGLPNKAIAARLNCSDGTVKLHVSAILRAFNARNRTEAVQAVAARPLGLGWVNCP